MTTNSIKAVGEWVLDVLGVPYGGPNDGKDAHGEYFTPDTELYLDQIKSPLVVYYHGFTPDGKPQGAPDVIGRVESFSRKQDGVWFRVVLDKANEYARRVWEAAQKNLARASSGTVGHLIRTAKDGEILNWAVAELSLFDVAAERQPANQYAVAIPALKSLYAAAGMSLPAEFDETKSDGGGTGEEQPGAAEPKPVTPIKSKEILDMDEKEIQALLDKRDADKEAAAVAKQAHDADVNAKVEAAVKAEREKWAKGNRLPTDDGAPNVMTSRNRKYDNIEPSDLALMIAMLKDTKKPASLEAMKTLAMKLESSEANAGSTIVQGIKVDNRQLYADALHEMKTLGIKANELDHTGQSGFGSDWVSTAYSPRLWEAIRQDPSIGAKLMADAIEVPQGAASLVDPLEGADPTWYKVAETTANNSTTGVPDATVTASKVATSSKTHTPAKMGARTIFSGEMEEDSIIPFIANLRRQLEVSCIEQFTHAVIDGDTATGATTNINNIGGTPGATDLYLLFNGFRKSPLVTTTALSRSAGGSLVAEDFLNTVKLMGSAGINALDVTKVSFIIDPNTHWKALTLPEVKTRDVFAQPTIEKGKLVGIYGYEVLVSAFMHYKSSVRKANTAGKVDQDTTANNTTGSILSVRWDQWRTSYKRRITVETVRFPHSDSTEIVAMLRVGLLQRDTNAAAISYNVGLS